MSISSVLFATLCMSNSMSHTIEKGGMWVALQTTGSRLMIESRAPTEGWLVVGFNRISGLQGARLVFMRVRAGRAECEVHRTDFSYPAPFHRPRAAIGGTNYVADIIGHQRDGVTQVGCSVPLASHERLDVALEPGAKLHVILAYSASDDFDHHSRMRTAVDITL